MAHYFYIWNQMGAVTVNWRAAGSNVQLQFLHLLVKAKLREGCLRRLKCIVFFHRTSYPKMIPFYFTDWNQSMKLLVGRGVLFADQPFQSSFTLQQKPIIITSAYNLFPKSLNENTDGSWTPVCRSNCSLSRFNQQHKPTFITDACGFYSSWYLGSKIYVIIKYIESWVLFAALA